MVGGAAAAVVSVVAVIGVLTFNNPSKGPVGGSTTTTPPAVTTTTVAPVPANPISNVVTAGPEGITIHDIVTGDVSPLVSDLYYETISWTVDDGVGGLIFAHEITPLPWAQGSIMWLPAG